MRIAKFFPMIAAAIILTTNASGECVSASVHVETRVDVHVDTENTRHHVRDFAEQARGIYTGLIIDCRGLGLRTAASPVIKNANGTKIYGHKDLDFDKITSMGMADYVRDIEQCSRAGEHPLIIKAIGLDNFNCNPVVSVADSNRILIENYATKFFKNLKVVFLFD